jgi:hypothetical protein
MCGRWASAVVDDGGWVLDLGYLNFLMILLILNVNFEMLILYFNY